MTNYRFMVSLLALTLIGCSDATPANTSEVVPKAVAVPVAAATSVKAAPPKRCSDGIAIGLDRPLMAREDGTNFLAARLDDLEHRLGTAFHAAADGLCGDDTKLARALKPVSSVVARSGAGASEPTFYLDPDHKGRLVFEWYFADADLAVPARADIEQGLRCWAEPERKDCADRGD
ncbi:MAG: hypothetical protein ABI810_13605 [Sphingomonas bacterium]